MRLEVCLELGVEMKSSHLTLARAGGENIYVNCINTWYDSHKHMWESAPRGGKRKMKACNEEKKIFS